MAIDKARADRLARLERAFASLPRPDIYSAEELARAEAARAARHHGFAQPAFRTSVKLRFSGDGIRGHDLPITTAGLVIGGVSEAVDAAAQDIKMQKDSTSLYLSPVVESGSTVLELFGPPVRQPAQEKIDTEIDDGPTDFALRHLFNLLDTVNVKSLQEIAGSDLNVSTGLANKLFALSNSLLESNVDLGMVWTRPRGTRRAAEFSRSTAYAFRSLLDVEETGRTTRTEVGVISYISTDGSIGFTFGERRDKTVTLDASDLEAERLRSLWATEVTLSWFEETTSHPRRGVRPQVARTFIDVVPQEGLSGA